MNKAKSPTQPSPRGRALRKGQIRIRKLSGNMDILINSKSKNHPSFGGAGGRLHYV